MRRKIVLLTFVLMVLLLVCPLGVYAARVDNDVDSSQTDRFGTSSPWLSGNEDQSIYCNTLEGGDGTSQIIQPDPPGMIEKYFSELLRNIASSCIDLLKSSLGASLDSIVYGRVGSGHPDSVNIFSFELRKGNPYGVTGAVAYSVVRSIAYVFMALRFIFLLAKASFQGYTERSRSELKQTFYGIFLNFCLLALMPFFWDVALYIRDVVLYGVKEVTSLLITGGGTLNLSDVFYINSVNSGTFVDAVMYLGTVVLTLYFVLVYVSIALDMLLWFIIFPVTCVMNRQGRNMMEGWCLGVFSDLCTPVIDAVLLLVPLLTSVMLSDVVKGVRIIQLVMCMLVIPMRGQIKAKLGISGGGERNGMFGLMAGMALGRMLGRRVKSIFGKAKDALSDYGQSRTQGELAEVDREEEEGLVADYNSRYHRTGEMPLGLADQGQRNKEENRRNAGLPGQNDMDQNAMEGQDGLKPEELDLSGGDLAGTGDGKEDRETEAGTRSEALPSTKEKALDDLHRSIEEKEDELADLRIEKADHLRQEKRARREMLDHEQGSPAYKRAMEETADSALLAGEAEKKIQKAGKQLSAMKAQEALLAGTRPGGHVAVSQYDRKRAEILAKRANINNFENPEWKGVLSHEKLQKLYRARAVRGGVQAVAETAGAVGGAALLGSMGSFMPLSTSAVMAGAGMQIGGESVGTVAGSAVDVGYSLASGRKRSNTAVKVSASPLSAAVHTGVRNDIGAAVDAGPVEQVVSVTRKDPHTSQFDHGVTVKEPSVTVTPAREAAVSADAGRVLEEMVTGSRGIHNSSLIKALKSANLQAEAQRISLEVEGRESLSKEQVRDLRVETQTKKIVETVLEGMETDRHYEKGTEHYRQAQEYLMEKVRKIVEDKNRDLF